MKNVKVNIFLLISQIVYTLFSAAWFIFAIMSLMMLATPEALSSVWALLMFAVIWIYPLGLIGSAIASWLLYHKRKFKKAVWISIIPLLWVLPIVWIYSGIGIS